MIGEFAERVQEMETDGYIDIPEHVVETISVDTFLKGCTDKKAALLAMEKNPTRMDQALQFKSDVRRVQFEKYDQDDSDDDSEIAVRVVNKKPNYVPWQETIEKRVLKTEQDITGINNNVGKILKILETRSNDNRRPRSPSPSRSPARTVTCYTCNQEGHYSNQCENKSNSSSPMRRNRSPSSANSRPNVHLNEQGSKKNGSCEKIKGSNIVKLVENKPVDTLGILSQEKSSMLTSQHEKPNACKAGLTGAYKQNSEDLKNSEVSVNDPYGPTVAASLILNVKINGVNVDAVVDTAAQVTIISEKFMKKLQPPLELKSSVTLKGAGAENKVKARYANRVSIRNGKTETKWQIIEADTTDSVLLGLDFLQHLQAVIDLANYTVKINNQTLQASAVKSNNTEIRADLSSLPCKGCAYCSRAQRTWGKFENDVDDVVPLAVQSIQHQLQDDISIQESNWMKGWSLEDIKKEQEDDPDLKTLMNWLHTGEPPSEHELQLESPATKHWWNCKTQLKFVKGCIFYKWLDQAKPRTLLLLPNSLKEEAMKYCHDCRTLWSS
ncbi:unnamed protein product [Mytilus coruscus]|uniref:CCHC-type domain-containing protein n=1 Tax=Mytilus coruscus TaxID=42192 RepID=A0A6J8CSZ3_MYTCO|nr:unnamed protein product [Mytilus coruscus]